MRLGHRPPGSVAVTCGNVGIGTTAAPFGSLDVRNTTGVLMHLALTDSSRYLWLYGGAGYYPAAIGWPAGSDFAFNTTTNINTSGLAEKMRITSAGNVGIGLTAPAAKLDVGGNIHATGSISADGALYAKYQDVAEWVPATVDMQPGTVVVLNRDRENEVMPSLRAYDTAVAGVVSAQPGLVLGVKGTSKEQIATTGRVKVKVDANAGAVRVGDLLVTSSKPGFAMVSQAVEVAGVQLHRPGTVIGKALQPLDHGTGEILVLLSLQ